MLVKWVGHAAGTREERHCINQATRKEPVVKTYLYIVKLMQWLFIFMRQRYLGENAVAFHLHKAEILT